MLFLGDVLIRDLIDFLVLHKEERRKALRLLGDKYPIPDEMAEAAAAESGEPALVGITREEAERMLGGKVATED